jgi:hypothetical protein
LLTNLSTGPHIAPVDAAGAVITWDSKSGSSGAITASV